MLFRFHANIFALPPQDSNGGRITLRGVELHTLRSQTFDAFFSVAFEEAYDALAQLPRIDIEPDGFFVISGDLDGRRWQLNGHLYDFGDRLHRVELHGDCPPESLDAILACIGWPQTPLAFELVMEGVALDEAAFRQFAAAKPTS
ncbi:hypothetical protein [Lacipirellula limnantheis]|uniref:Uncharacterized protein n=1 Tax=Lacipirellula limnantheis TaxID=2528024 RepID=A0A517TRC4_9BACT|nr:hypothetical protein [Lacipirellula limnantheis]QDT70920.1 hypothetical protein I41_00730 [Lacipirellula limnantheis]